MCSSLAFSCALVASGVCGVCVPRALDERMCSHCSQGVIAGKNIAKSQIFERIFFRDEETAEARITDSEQKLVITILVEENRKNKLMLEEQRELNILLVNENVNLKWDRSVEHYRRPVVVTHSPRH